MSVNDEVFVMIFGAILAGGVGSSLHMADMPKQFLPLGEKPIIIHTLEKFLMCADLQRVYIGVHRDWINYTEDLVRKYVGNAAERVCVVCGGSDRNETIQNVIATIEKDHGASDEHIIVTHDAVRPFVTLRMIEENIAYAKEYGAVDTVTSAIDTIVVSENGKPSRIFPTALRCNRGRLLRVSAFLC